MVARLRHAYKRSSSTGPLMLDGRPALSRSVASTDAAVAAVDASQRIGTDFNFACPICLMTEFVVPSVDPYQQQCSCSRCGRSFDSKSNYLDLTLTSGVQQQVYQQKMWRGTELFRQPLISFIYERGWRQNFAGAGFPGPDKEYQMAMEYLQSAVGGVLVDASCGTGLFTRLFARSRKFRGVVALDFSETMLQQAQQFFSEDSALAISTPIVAVRGDIGRLPFATGSVDAIHAGAAIHCWPNPQAAMAEVSRALRPGGVFVASTFLTPLSPLGEIIGDQTVRPISQVLNPFNENNNTFRYWQEDELKDLVSTVGLSNYQRKRSRMFIMFAATKPQQQQQQ
jgi:ubiquinone/menaquinone biosynthesis C-methylase UbiE